MRSALLSFVAAGLLVSCSRSNPLFQALDDVGGSGDDGGVDTKGDDDDDTVGDDDDDVAEGDDDDDVTSGGDDDDDDDDADTKGDDDDDLVDTGSNATEGATDEGPGDTGEAPLRVYFYTSPMQVDGDLSEFPDIRNATTSGCAVLAMNQNIPCSDAVALFTVGPDDDIFGLADHGLPTDLPIITPGGDEVAEDYDALLADGPFEGVEEGSTYWTGQAANPKEAANCAGWSTARMGASASIYDPGVDPLPWYASEGTCNVSRHFMCLCW